MFLADSLGFLDLEGQLEKIDPAIKCNLMHVTAAPPWAKSMAEIKKAAEQFGVVVEKKLNSLWCSRKWELKEVKDNEFWIVSGIQRPPHDVDVKALIDIHEISITTLAYNHEESPFGGGWPNKEVGLTERGKQFLEECAEHGMIVDLSHASAETTLDALSFAQLRLPKLGICATHSGCWEIFHHDRNMAEADMRIIANRGGYIGIPTLLPILDDKDEDLRAFRMHLKYVINACGEDAVGIGSDAPYCSRPLSEIYDGYKKLVAKLDTAGHLKPRFPMHPLFLYHPYKLEVIARELERSFPIGTVEKIMGLNFRRFLAEYLPK